MPSVENGATSHMIQALNLHGIHSVSSMSCSRGGEILGDRIGEKPFCLLLIHRKIMMDVQKYFSEVFVARIAKQKHHRDTELVVNTQLIWIAILSDIHS